MALGAYEGEAARGNVLNALAHPTVVNPVAAIGNAVQTARGIADLRTTQFNLQQAQLQPGYQAMRMLYATNPNPSMDDIQAALGGAARIGGNVDGLVQNLSDWTGRGGTTKDFVRAYALGGMSPENQAQFGIGTPASVDTGAAIVSGLRGGALSSTPGVFTPGASIGRTVTPAEATDMVPVGVNPDGSAKMVPRWQVSGSGAPGIGSAGVGSTTGNAPAAAPAGPPPGSNIQPGQPMSQKDQDLATFAQRESGNQNILSRVPVPPGYTQNQAGSGYYQIIPSTWAVGQQLAGIPQNQRTQMAMQASPQQQYAVASALYDKYGGSPWARSAPQGQGGTAVAAGPPGATTAQQGYSQPSGPFIGATSAQPVTGAGANVRPAGGMQYFDPYGRPVAGPGGGQGGPPAGGYGGYSTLPAGQAESLRTAAEASTKQYAADNADAGQFQRRMWPLTNAEHILETEAPTTGQGAEAVRSIIGHLQTFGNIFTGGDITNIGQSSFEKLGKYMQQVVNSSPFAASSNDKLAAAITGSPNTHMTNLANQEVLKAMIAQERMKQLAITDFNNQGGQPMNWSNFLRQWQTTHDLRAGLIDMLPQDKRQQLVKSMTETERTNFQNTLTLLKNNPGVMSGGAMP